MRGNKAAPVLTIDDIEDLSASDATPLHEKALPLFCFASRSQDNIRRALDAKRWAVPPTSGATRKGWNTRAKKMQIGSNGVFYCCETQSFTAPFIVASRADPLAMVTDIWDGEWILPFDISPLGCLTQQLHKRKALMDWPFLRALYERKGSVPGAMNLTGIATFVPVEILESDWLRIVSDLSEPK